MSVNIKKNGTLTKLAGLYDSINLRLSQLLDTDISSLEDGQILAYNNTTSKWENQTPNFSDKFIITFTLTGIDPETDKPILTADKTPAETVAAINGGKLITGSLNTGDETFHLSTVTSFVGSDSDDSIYLVLGSSFYVGYEEEGELRTYTLDIRSSHSTPESTWESIDITFGDIENVHPIIKFYVNEDEGVYSMDQNFQELLDAYYSHQSIFLTCNGQEYAYEKYDSSTHTFYFTSTLADSIKTFVLVGNYSTGEWTSITLEEVQVAAGGSSTHTYSTEKHAVGTWIDGRTIYEQTYEIEVTEKTSTNNHYYNITIPTSNADNFVFINIDAMYNIRYDATITSSGSVVHYNKFQHVHEYFHADNNCYAYIQSADLAYNIHQPNAQIVFAVNYYPESTSSLTISNINAKIYATVQFVESAE